MSNQAILTVILLFLCAPNAFAYDPATHREMSKHAANQSVLSSPDTLKQLGLEPVPVDSKSQQFVSFTPDSLFFTSGDSLSILGLISFGSEYEDNRRDIQAFRHFFNPLNGQGLDYSGVVPQPLQLLTSIPSPTWALEDTASYTNDDQPFSYKKAHGYFYDALTNTTKKSRDASWGKTFQTLGHVIHHLQDMAQPQHVRNDLHCDNLICIPFPGLYNNSGYEQWTKANPPADTVFDNYPSVYSAADNTTFTSPRQLWTTTTNSTDGLGIAEYTNRGFYSLKTIPDTATKASDFPSPPLNTGINSTTTISALCQEAVASGEKACPDAIATLGDSVMFVGNTVTDSLHPEMTQINPRAASLSIFDRDLVLNGSQPRYTMNRFNYDAAKTFLLPRAVAYSSGLINFFFRGKMTISLPDEGIYGVIDHNDATANARDTGGFTVIKLKVQNVTPKGTGIEPMTGAATAGSLVAVAKFHRNTCYTPDLGGEYGSPNIDWTVCRNKDEEIVVSQPVPAPDGIDAAPTEITFNFASPGQIPINATDLFLQVVYRGPLGDEADAVVVATKDISEPTYSFNYRPLDQFAYAGFFSDPTLGDRPYSQWCLGGLRGFPTLDACNQALGFTRKYQFSPTTSYAPGYDPATLAMGRVFPRSLEPALTPVITLVTPVGSLSRIALLTDALPTNYVTTVEEEIDTTPPGVFVWGGGVALAESNQLDNTTGAMNTSVHYLPGRGVYLPDSQEGNLTTGNAAKPFPPFILVPSIIQF